jgi:ATP-dependent Clp protease adaptor protein ClpS
MPSTDTDRAFGLGAQQVERAKAVGVTRPRPGADARPKLLPPYCVVLHDDPINGFGYVMRTLRKVFHYNAVHAFLLTLRAHRTGRAAVWTGAKEHAEFRADQLRSCGPDPMMAHRGAGSLGVSIEPMPGRA